MATLTGYIVSIDDMGESLEYLFSKYGNKNMERKAIPISSVMDVLLVRKAISVSYDDNDPSWLWLPDNYELALNRI